MLGTEFEWTREYRGPLERETELMACHTGQVLERSASVHGYSGCDQISLQGHVDAGVPKAD